MNLKSYSDVLSHAGNGVVSISNWLIESAVRLALSDDGPWGKWSGEQPVGARVDISPQALMETNDEKIRALVTLAMSARETAEGLRRKGKKPKKPALKLV